VRTKITLICSALKNVHTCEQFQIQLHVVHVVALTPYLEAKGVNLDRFFSYLHGVGTVTGVVLYVQMCSR